MTSLCQRETASCGACCGLYNREDFSAEALAVELRRRTRALAGVPRTREAFRAAAAGIARGDAAPLFPSVRVCALLGYLDEAETRVGCLAHPLSTGGADLRDCGAYDVTTCEAFLCPSHAWLRGDEPEIVERTCADWHLYGLVVTDVEFVQGVLAALAGRVGQAIEARHLGHARFRAALRRLFDLKTSLAPGSDGLFGAFRPGRDGEPVPRQIDYEALGRGTSAYDLILRCVGADPRSGNDLDAIEDEVRRRLDAAAKAFPLPSPGPSPRPAPR